MHATPAAAAASPESSVAPTPAWERWGLVLIMLGFVVVGLRHVHGNTMFGQDFLLHSTATENIVADPAHWFPQDFTNRPLVYWIGAGCLWLTHAKAPWELAGLAFVMMNAVALGFFHASTRRCIQSPWLRLAAIAFLAFLPATQVASVVYAADAVAMLPFALTVWCLVRTLEAESTRTRAGYALLTALALVLGCFARYTFNAIIAAVLVALLLEWRARRISFGRAMAVAALALVIPTLTAGYIAVRAHRHFAGDPPHHVFDWHGTGEMTWSSLLLVKRADVRILDAPGYWDNEMIDGTLRLGLLVNNRFSYPALLHLSMFTDVLDYANQGQIDDGTARPAPQALLARCSVRLGVPFSLAMLLAVTAFTGRCAWALARPARAPETALIVFGVFALAWYLPLVLTLPFVHSSYDWGYWLSRLVIPALWGFAVVLFATADQLLTGHPWVARLLATVVFGQAVLHAASLWY